MSTSTEPTPATGGSVQRSPLRLRLVEHVGRDRLDGGWWPQSRDLAVELADLAEHLPRELGRVVRIVFSPPDWDTPPRRVAVPDGYAKADPFPHDAAHLIQLETDERTVLHVLVVPPELTDPQGEEALLAAASPGNTHSAVDLLDTVTEHPDIDPADHWE
jgi:hypothetical protein